MREQQPEADKSSDWSNFMEKKLQLLLLLTSFLLSLVQLASFRALDRSAFKYCSAVLITF